MSILGNVGYDCSGFKILASVPFDESTLEPKRNFVVCTSASKSLGDSIVDKGLFGTFCVTTQHEYISEQCLGIKLAETELSSALNTFMLAIGFSLVQFAELELGDVSIVTGNGALSQSILLAAALQGAFCVHLIGPNTMDSNKEFLKILEQQVLVTGELDWETLPSDLKFFAQRRSVFFETTGASTTIAALLPKLRSQGHLILCRSDGSSDVVFNAYRDLHRTSALVSSWPVVEQSIIESSFLDAYQRASNILKHRSNLRDFLLKRFSSPN